MPLGLDALGTPPLDRLRAVCPGCRRLVLAGTACPLDGSDPLELRVIADRDQLVDATWGVAEQREAMREAAQKKTGASRARTGLGAFGLTFVTGFAVQGDVLLAFLTGLLGGTIGLSVGSARGRILVPNNAPPLPAWSTVGTGAIVSAPAAPGLRDIIAPGSSMPCVAWALELRFEGSWGHRTTLRAGATAGFDVQLDSGGLVRIPGGAIWMDDRLVQVDRDDAVVDDLVRLVDPHGAHSSWPLFPFNVILEQTLLAHDRVEVRGTVEPRPIAGDAARLFRDAPSTMLVPTALPILRRA